jgi:hypothetical protein
MTDDGENSEVEKKLREQQLTKPSTKQEMAAFYQAMFNFFEMKDCDRLADIRGWAESWQSNCYRTEKPPAS